MVKDKAEKTAIIYARVSTVRQAEDELPIESQIEQCKKKAVELGVIVKKIFRDDGKSGRYDTRPGFQSAINYSNDFSPDYFITWSSSRFARNIEDSILYKKKLSRAGVDLIYVSLDVDRDTIGGFALDHIMSLFDDIYSRQVSEDTKRSMIKNATDGYYNGGNVPFGYKAVVAEDNKKRKRLSPKSDEVCLVKEIFNQNLKGIGLQTIAVNLNENNKLNRDRLWNKTSISALLKNYTVIGKIAFNKKNRKTGTINPKEQWIIVDAHQPIIDMNTWNQVQINLRANSFEHSKGSANSKRLFTGLLRHSKCGGSMQSVSGTGRTKTYHYYNCRNSDRKGQCENRRINADDLDRWLLSKISDEVFTEENLKRSLRDIKLLCSRWSSDRRKRKSSLLTKIKTVEEKNNKIFEIMEEFGKNTPNLGDITKRLRANNNEINSLESELIELDESSPPEVDITQADIAELTKTLKNILETSDNPKKIRIFLGSFIESIDIHDHEVEVNYKPQMIIGSNLVRSTKSWLPSPDSNQGQAD